MSRRRCELISRVCSADFQSALRPRRRFGRRSQRLLGQIFAAAATCLSLALDPTARAESSTNQSAPAESPLAADTNAVATYDGGSIMAGDVAEYVDEPHFLADADQNAPPNVVIGLEEKVARHLAAVRILVQTARQKRWVGPGWPLEAKLIEQGVLAQALTDESRREVFVSEQEVNEQYRTNRFKLIGFDTVEAGRIGISAQKHGTNALERAKAALALIRGGQDFVAVARQYSDLEPKLAQKESYPPHLWGKSGDLALAELGEGKVSDPLPVQDGFELVKVERIHLYGNPSPEEAKANLRIILNDTGVGDRIAEMSRAAEAAFPFITAQTNPSPSTLNPQASTNVVLLGCGQFALTQEDFRGFARQRELRPADEQKLPETIQRDNGGQIQLGELARSMGFDKRPDVRKALRYELDKQLAEKARQALVPEFAAALTFDESQIRDAYEHKWTETVDPRLQYDALIVPLTVPPNATPDERQVAVSNAQFKARELIRQAQTETNLNTIVAADPALRLMASLTSVVNDGSALEALVAGLKAGEVAAQPYEDLGGYCVLRVHQYEPRRKTPYEMARAYIVESLQWDARGDVRRNFESLLLKKHHFAFGPPAAARMRDSASAPTKTNLPK